MRLGVGPPSRHCRYGGSASASTRRSMRSIARSIARRRSSVVSSHADGRVGAAARSTAGVTIGSARERPAGGAGRPFASRAARACVIGDAFQNHVEVSQRKRFWQIVIGARSRPESPSRRGRSRSQSPHSNADSRAPRRARRTVDVRRQVDQAQAEACRMALDVGHRRAAIRRT